MEIFTICQFTHCSDDCEPVGFNKAAKSLEKAMAIVQEYVDSVLIQIAKDENREFEAEPV